MKKITGIVLGVFAVAFVAAILFLYLRKQQARDQLVHTRSAALLTIHVDDLLLDNFWTLISASSADTSASESPSKTVWKQLWQAGLELPAQIIFFSLPEDPYTYYSLQKINDAKKWASVGWRQDDDSPGMQTDPKIRHFHSGKYISGVDNGSDVLFRIGYAEGQGPDDLEEMLSKTSDWKSIKDMSSFATQHSAEHINYYNTDGVFSLHAYITNTATTINGQWKKEQQGSSPLLQREINSDNAAFMLWSNLPLREMPLLSDLLKRFFPDQGSTIIDMAPGYFDILVSKEQVRQQDTIVSYDYDENFNSVEKKELQDKHVPLMEIAWKAGNGPTEALPNKMFYHWYRHQQDELLILSTRQESKKTGRMRPAKELLQLAVEMENWPEQWNVPFFEKLQRQQVKALIHAKPETDGLIKIKGEISYNELIQ